MGNAPKKIYMFTKDGDLVKIFDSLEACATHFKTDVTQIFNVVEQNSIFKKRFVLRPDNTFSVDRTGSIKSPVQKKKKSALPASSSGSVLETKVLEELNKTGKRTGITSLYETIKPSIPVSLFGALVNRMVTEGKIRKSGRYFRTNESVSRHGSTPSEPSQKEAAFPVVVSATKDSADLEKRMDALEREIKELRAHMMGGKPVENDDAAQGMSIGEVIQLKVRNAEKSAIEICRMLGMSRGNLDKIYKKDALATDVLAKFCLVLGYDFFTHVNPFLSKVDPQTGRPIAVNRRKIMMLA